MPWGVGPGNTDAPVIWWQPSCETNFQPTRQPSGTVRGPWNSALTGMACLFPAHQGRDHTQFRSSAHFCSPNACWCYRRRLFPSLWQLQEPPCPLFLVPYRFSPERSVASSISPSLLLEAQLCHIAHSSKWYLSILMVFTNLEWRFDHHTPLITYDGGE